jgi:hypothetical protein
MSRIVKIGVAVAVFVGVFALAWFVYYPQSPLGKQNANLKLAEKLRPMVEQRVQQLEGADHIRVGIDTGWNGSLSVSGHVANEHIAEVVIREVLATKPPIAVRFEFIVRETESINRTFQPEDRATPRP